MIPNSLKALLVPLALTLVSVCSDAARATTQTIYPFTGNYRTTINIIPIKDNVSQTFEVGVSDDAPYDLLRYEGLTYSVTDAEGNTTFNNNPETFGLEGYPMGYLVLEGGANKLFGTSDASVSLDLENLTGTGSGFIYISGGEGIFENATGTLLFSEEDIVNPGPPITLNGLALVTGSIEVAQKVPEPTTTTVLVGMGALGVVSLLRRYRLQVTG